MPLDSEILEIQRVHRELEGRTYKRHNLDSFQREIVERFGQIGWKVDVKWFSTNVAGTYIPQVDIVDRIETKEFDHDQMAHEVQNDILGLGEGGLIKDTRLRDEARAHAAKKGNHKSHKDGSGCC